MDSPRERAGRQPGTTTAWAILVGAGLLEIGWAIALKQADGFTRLGPSALAVVTALVSFILLAVALRTLPVGTAYAVWVGIGAVGVVAAGIVVLGESASPQRLVFLSLIVVGVAGLRVVEGRTEESGGARESTVRQDVRALP